jgi:ABC-type multidrug transport system ATPase subunit/pSer/pThr/pTyr-binding forkhead associated (FHA) protein/ABC-type multidrug transport system permease subunit
MSSQSAKPARSWLIGTSAACDIKLSQSTVSGQHCRLTETDGGFLIEDLGSRNGTFVGNHRLDPRTPLRVSPLQTILLADGVPVPWPDDIQSSSSGSAPSATPAARTIQIGRAPDCDVCLDYPMISAHHARISEQHGTYFIEDLNSRNGTSLNRVQNRITHSPLQTTDDIFLGSYKVSASWILQKRKAVVGEAAFATVLFQSQAMTIGRDPACEQPVSHPTISWHHARLTRNSAGTVLEDLGSLNGTFLNGVRISSKTQVQPGQEIGIGSIRFQLLPDGNLARRDYAGNVSIEAQDVTVLAPDGRPLLEPISLVAYPSELIAMMGPAGAGKTTLLKALNGYSRPASGSVLFNGLNLYRHYDRFSQQLAYVPQDDIVHPQLTVREALYFSARLRTDLTDDEIETRIDKLLRELNLSDKKNTVIGSPENKVLSGGQRKRVNIAMELITDTPVLFLDEPTSGLSSYDAEGVVHLLKELSRQGKTIIATIHQPSLHVFREFDNLIMLTRDSGGCGTLAFFGPAYPDSIDFLHPRTPEQTQSSPAEPGPELLLTGLAKSTASDWSRRFRESRYRKQFVEDRARQSASTIQAPVKEASRRFNFTQWITLLRRNTIVKLRNRAQMAILGLQSPLIAALIVLVYGKVAATASTFQQFQDMAANIIGIHILMVVAAIWFGCNNATRDIVGEWTIFYRERMVNLKLPSYVFSKFILLLALSVLQCAVMLGIVYFLSGLKADFFRIGAVLVLASAVGTTLGLAISARSSSTESAIALLPIVLLPVIVLGGGLKQIYRMPTAMQWLSTVIPSRWAFEYDLVNEASHRNACLEVPGPCASPTSPVHAGHGTAASSREPGNATFPTGASSHEAAATNSPMVSSSNAALQHAAQPLLYSVDSADFQVPTTVQNGDRVKPDPSHSRRLNFLHTLGILGSMLVVLLSSVFIFLRSRVPH